MISKICRLISLVIFAASIGGVSSLNAYGSPPTACDFVVDGKCVTCPDQQISFVSDSLCICADGSTCKVTRPPRAMRRV